MHMSEVSENEAATAIEPGSISYHLPLPATNQQLDIINEVFVNRHEAFVVQGPPG